MDFTSITKELAMEVPHTHHAVDEYIVLTGADMNSFFEFGERSTCGSAMTPRGWRCFLISPPLPLSVSRPSFTTAP
jgi:hypothetical protein